MWQSASHSCWTNPGVNWHIGVTSVSIGTPWLSLKASAVPTQRRRIREALALTVALAVCSESKHASSAS
jgi:hypothetical protein